MRKNAHVRGKGVPGAGISPFEACICRTGPEWLGCGGAAALRKPRVPHKDYFNEERMGRKEGPPQLCRRRVHVKTKKRPRQSRGRAGKQWFCLAAISARHTGKPPWRPSGLPWGLFVFCIQIGGANPLCSAGRDNFPAAAGEASAACPLQAGALLRKTAPASGGSRLPAASGYVALQNRRTLHCKKHGRRSICKLPLRRE